MDKSQLLYLSFRYNFHREALGQHDVRQIFIEEGVPFDPEVVAEWRDHVETQKPLHEVFETLPAEAIEHKPSLITLAARFMFEPPANNSEAAWRILAAGFLTVVMAGGYLMISHPGIVKQVIRSAAGIEAPEPSGSDEQLLRLLKQELRGIQ
jgi:hypothetical protein|tara:strand:+ start:325 stop:780 length:456 start_codon:yes stop_codon:yes gene_type:complete